MVCVGRHTQFLALCTVCVCVRACQYNMEVICTCACATCYAQRPVRMQCYVCSTTDHARLAATLQFRPRGSTAAMVRPTLAQVAAAKAAAAATTQDAAAKAAAATTQDAAAKAAAATTAAVSSSSDGGVVPGADTTTPAEAGQGGDGVKRRRKKDAAACPGPVGIGAPRDPGVAAPVSVLAPALPQSGADTAAWPIMRDVVVWCLANLSARFFVPAKLSADAPHLHAPLRISTAEKESSISSYQEPWDTVQCKHAVRTTGFYQAAANITWLNPSLMDLALPVDDPSFDSVVGFADRCFSVEALAAGSSTTRKRLLFPVVLEAYVQSVQELSADTFRQSLQVLGGHSLLFGWWLAVFRSLSAADADLEHLRMLWECGLSTTVLVRCAPDAKTCCIASMRLSETFRHLQGLADTFVLFARKVRKLAPEDDLSLAAVTQVCQDNDIRYNGAQTNKTMLVTVKNLVEAMESDLGFAAAILHLERKHGKDLLSNSYNKLGRLVQICQMSSKGLEKLAAKGWCSTPTFLVELMCLDLDRGRAAASFFTLSALDKAKDGTPGWLHTGCCKSGS